MARDWIRLVNMSFYGYHGVHDEERRLGRVFFVDVEMALDLREAARADDVGRTVDYGEVYALVREIEAAKQYALLEALVTDIAAAVLDRFPRVEEVTVRARKPEVPVGGLMDHAEVEITRRRED
jgi:dihydroneopterin aldolase